MLRSIIALKILSQLSSISDCLFYHQIGIKFTCTVECVLYSKHFVTPRSFLSYLVVSIHDLVLATLSWRLRQWLIQNTLIWRVVKSTKIFNFEWILYYSAKSFFKNGFQVSHHLPEYACYCNATSWRWYLYSIMVQYWSLIQYCTVLLHTTLLSAVWWLLQLSYSLSIILGYIYFVGWPTTFNRMILGCFMWSCKS